MNLTKTEPEPEFIDPETRVDPTFHFLSLDTASARDSVLFMGVAWSHGARVANALARDFGWDLSALKEWKRQTES